jgi:hypothetical protein
MSEMVIRKSFLCDKVIAFEKSKSGEYHMLALIMDGMPDIRFKYLDESVRDKAFNKLFELIGGDEMGNVSSGWGISLDSENSEWEWTVNKRDGVSPEMPPQWDY